MADYFITVEKCLIDNERYVRIKDFNIPSKAELPKRFYSDAQCLYRDLDENSEDILILKAASDNSDSASVLRVGTEIASDYWEAKKSLIEGWLNSFDALCQEVIDAGVDWTGDETIGTVPVER